MHIVQADLVEGQMIGRVLFVQHLFRLLGRHPFPIVRHFIQYPVPLPPDINGDGRVLAGLLKLAEAVVNSVFHNGLQHKPQGPAVLCAWLHPDVRLDLVKILQVDQIEIVLDKQHLVPDGHHILVVF